MNCVAQDDCPTPQACRDADTCGAKTPIPRDEFLPGAPRCRKCYRVVAKGVGICSQCLEGVVKAVQKEAGVEERRRGTPPTDHQPFKVETREDLLKFHQWAAFKMYEICKAKNADYAGAGGESPFANFARVEVMGIATTEQGFLTRMTDKLSRLASLTAAGVEAQVKDESIEDTLLDLANYCILLAAYRRSKA